MKQFTKLSFAINFKLEE